MKVATESIASKRQISIALSIADKDKDKNCKRLI